MLDPRIVALHEAAHAVVGRFLDLPAGSISILPSPSSAGHACVGADVEDALFEARDYALLGEACPARARRALESAALMLIAGEAAVWHAEKLVLVPPVETAEKPKAPAAYRADSDAEQLATILWALAWTAAEKSALNNTLIRRAQALVALPQVWRAIVAIANALLERGELDGATVDALYHDQICELA